MERANIMSRKSSDDALALVSQKQKIPQAVYGEEHPYILARCGGTKTFDDKSNVIVSNTPDESNAVGFQFSGK